MKKFLLLTVALLLCSSLSIPSVSSYGGGGVPPNTMLERENVRTSTHSRVQKNVKRKTTKKVQKKKMPKKETPPQRSQRKAMETTNVTIEQFSFQPQRLTVKVGTTITWINKDSPEHTATGEGGLGPQSDRLGNGEGYSYTFTEAGTFPYHCTPHPSMKGTVEVTP